MLSDKALQEFKQIYKDEYGVDLQTEEATAKALQLLTFMKAIYKQVNIYKFMFQQHPNVDIEWSEELHETKVTLEELVYEGEFCNNA